MKTTTYNEYKEKINNFVEMFNTNDLTETYHYDHFRDYNPKSRKYNNNHGREFFVDGKWQFIDGGLYGKKYLIRTSNGKSAEFAYYRYYILEGTQHNYKVYRVNLEDLPVKVAKAPWKGKK